jgi:hypothetical protein
MVPVDRDTSSSNVLAPAFRSEAASWFMERLYSLPALAHHPNCSCFDRHVLRLGRLVLCLGCTCAAAGAVLACVLLAWVYGEATSVVQTTGVTGFMIIGVGLYTPTLLQPFCQAKPYKMLARTMLGMGVVVLWVGALVLLPLDMQGFALRICFVIIFWLVYRWTLWMRGAFTPDPCRRCSSAGYPFCPDNQRRLMTLVRELERRARPEDAAFVAFANALSGGETAGVTVHVATLGRVTDGLPKRWPCAIHGAGHASGISRPS